MTQITLQDGKLVLRDGKVGTGEGCCCGGGGGCDCCDEPDNELVVVEGNPRTTDQDRYIIAGPGATEAFQTWLNSSGATKKESAPDRACEPVAYEFRIRSRFTFEVCAFRFRWRIYARDCETNALVDITDDYNEPADLPGFTRYGFWEWGTGDADFCAGIGFALPVWLDPPVCLPLP